MNHRGASGQWSDEAVACLREMLKEGRSYGAIAKHLSQRFGTSWSRNAVCGKVHRLGLGLKDKRAEPHYRPRTIKTVQRGAKAYKRALEENAQAQAQEPAEAASDGIRKWDRLKQRAGQDAHLVSVAKSIGKLKANPVPQAPFEPLPGSAPRPWTTRRLGECCWPVGTPDEPADQLSCCEPTKPGHRYCKAHWRMKRPTAEAIAAGRRKAEELKGITVEWYARADHGKRRKARQL